MRIQRRNGLQLLKGLGVPDSALTALLVLVATLTLIPYVAGREFGYYTIPEILPPVTFWVLALSMPVIWVPLLARVFSSDKIYWRTSVSTVAVIESAAVIMAIVCSPKSETIKASVHLDRGEHKTPVVLILPSSQRLEVTLAAAKPDREVMITICGASEPANCLNEQHGIGSTFVRYLPRGRVAVSVLHFYQNPEPIDLVLEVKYVKRRFL
jgi:hypothetical protein